MSRSQERVYKAIKKLIEMKGYSPSIREIAIELNKSVATIYVHLENLKYMKYIDYEKGKSRTIKILK